MIWFAIILLLQVKPGTASVSTFTEVRTAAHRQVAEDEYPMEIQMSGGSLGESPWRKAPILLSPGKRFLALKKKIKKKGGCFYPPPLYNFV